MNDQYTWLLDYINSIIYRILAIILSNKKCRISQKQFIQTTIFIYINSYLFPKRNFYKEFY